MRLLMAIALSLGFVGCAKGKMGKIDQEIDRSAVTKTVPIYVESISTKDTMFSGDKAGDLQRVKEEKTAIESRYHAMIVEALKKRGYNAQIAKGKEKAGLIVSGHIFKFEHGSAAARGFVGMGAGSSNLIGDFKVEDKAAGKTLSKFQVIGTSGGNSNMGSFLEAHLKDGSDKVAEYITGVK